MTSSTVTTPRISPCSGSSTGTTIRLKSDMVRTMAPSAPVNVTNAELATIREAMRELPRLLAELDAGTIDKLVLTQRNQMRAVLVSVERYSALEQAAT